MRIYGSRPLWLSSVGHLTIELCSQYLPVLYPLLVVSMDLNYTEVGTIAMVSAVSYSLAQPFFGYLSDRRGLVRLGSLSIVWIGVAMGLVGFSWNYVSLLVLIVLGALASAAFHPAGAVIAAGHSGPKRGTGLSIFSVGGSIGSALSPLWMGAAILLWGMQGTATLIPLGAVVGTLVYLQFRRASLDNAEQTRKSAAPAAHGFLVGLVLIVLAMMFRSWYQVAFTTYLPLWLQSEGGTLTTGSQYLALMMFSVSVGSFVGGIVADRVGYWQVVAVSLAFLSPTLWFFLTGAGPGQVIALAVMGVALGATYPTSIVLALDAWPQQAGLASGLLMGLGWMPGGLGATFTGYLADRYSLTFALLTLVIAPILGLLCVLAYAGVQRARRVALAQPQ